ncbi:MAG: hypothetical protein HZB18_16035 [Chloroflexi bacterium]|nr:hypothetical protein [Chloroflexota bacterium]
MKNLLRVAILLALLLTSCQSSSPPEDADVSILFTDGACELLKAPDVEIPNPIRIAVKNPTENAYAIVIVTLRSGFTKADLESYKVADVPPSVDRIIDHMDPDLKGDWLVEELPMNSNTDYFVVCAQEGVGILSVPLALNSN